MTTLALSTLPTADSWDMHDGWGGAWMVPMMLGMALFWGAIVLGFVWLVRDGSGHRQERPEQTALTILDRRFAEGALSLADYRQRRDVLAGRGGRRPDESVLPHESERRER